MSNNPQHTSLDDALTLMTTGRGRVNNNKRPNYTNNGLNNDHNNHNNSNYIKYAPSRPSPLKQTVDNNKQHANNIGSPFIFGKQNDNKSDTVSVFRTINQTNPSTRPTGAGNAAFLSFFDGPAKRMDENHTIRGNNTNGMGFNNNTNPGFEVTFGGQSTHNGNNSTTSAFGHNKFTGNNSGNSSMTLTNDNNTNSRFGSAFNGPSNLNNNFNNFNNNTSAFGYNKPSGSNTGGSAPFNTNTSSPFAPMDCTIEDDNPRVGSAFGVSSKPTGNNNFFNNSNTINTTSPFGFTGNSNSGDASFTGNPSMDFTDDTNSGFGPAFDGSPKPNNNYGNFNTTPTSTFAQKKSTGKDPRSNTPFTGNTPSNAGLQSAFNGPPKRSGNNNNNSFGKFNKNNNNNNNIAKPGLQSAFGEPSKLTGMNNNASPFTASQTASGSGKKNALGKHKEAQKRFSSFLTDDNDDSSSSSNSVTSQRKKNSTKADRAARFGSTNKTATYDEMKQNRIEERRLAIENGTIPDPNAPTRLEDAIDFRGTCTTMCPEFEMVERDLQNGLDPLEMDEGGNVDLNKAVKTYRRSAAGNEQPLPCDVRSPSVLIKTLDYLMGTILIQQPLEKCHPFLRDRTRSIRQDFTLQNIRDESAVVVHERIARFHILCLHEMCELDEERFSEQQETEQLRKVLLSLIEFYEDLREDGVEMENEPEFRAYHLISHIRDPDAVNKLQTLPKHLFLHPYVQRALEFYGLIQRNNEIMETSSRRNKPENVQASQNFYTQFFKLVRDPGTPFLMACMLEWHFPNVRKGALKAMNAAHRHAGVDVEFLRQNLGYDTSEMVIEDAQVYGLVVDSTPSGAVVRFHQKNVATGRGIFFIEPLSNPKQRRSLLLVDPKKDGLSLLDIVNGTDAIPPARRTSIPRLSLATTSLSQSKQQTTPRSVGFVTKATPKTVLNDAAYHQQRQQQWQVVQEGDHQQHQPSQQQQQDQQDQQRLLAEKVKKRQEEIDIQLKAQREKIQQYEAAKREKQERERMETELKQQQQQQQQLVQQQQQQQQMMAAEQQQAIAREKERVERERLEAEQQAKHEAQLREMEIKNRRRAVIQSQVKKRLADQLTAVILKETVTRAIKTMHRNHNLAKRYSKSWLRRARERISSRHAKTTKRVQQHHFSSFFCPPGQQQQQQQQQPWVDISTIYQAPERWNDTNNNAASLDAMIHEKATLALELENAALSTHTSLPQGLWDTVEYADAIYPLVRSKWDRIRTRMEETEDRVRPGWQLWINVADATLPSSQWFKAKFGLNDTFSRNVKYFEDCRITIRSIKNQDITYGKAVDELGAVIFSLSEIRHDNSDDIHTDQHWMDEQERLKEFTSALKNYNPKVRVPFVFTYWPGTTSLKDMLIKIPKLLDLENIDVISNFHILLMNPATIQDRLTQEINWLSTNSIINQPLKMDYQAILKMRALVVAVEKTTCHFKVGEVTLTEAIHLANKKIQTYNEYLVDVPFNWTPFVVPVIPEQPMGDRPATGDDLFDLGCMWVDEVAKKRIIDPVKGGAENLGAVVEGILKLHLYELERRLKRPIVSFV